MVRKSGIMVSEISFANLPLILKGAGLDFFILDCEHGGFDYSDVSKILTVAKLCKLDCIVRLADNSRKDITKMMDMGAMGLLLPMTNCAADIEKMVDRIVEDKIDDGQLDNCEITLNDIGKIKQSFMKVLEGIFHSRIEYPEVNYQAKEGEVANGRA
jgi:imidazolonepropionase-like amidohydrolase